ncbi:MAG: hypothetical protein JWL77_6968, partial [Chthonomonadaceae bacterium]|nr:hypothetical protein [Chthonomonadaceae bacterium]
MSTEEIRAYVLAELHSHDGEVARLVEMGHQLTAQRHTAQELQPMLQGIE